MNSYANSKDPGLGEVYRYESVWDAFQMHGCLCDDHFLGPDCSLRKCQTGNATFILMLMLFDSFRRRSIHWKSYDWNHYLDESRTS
jgi:hypothetical protein